MKRVMLTLALALMHGLGIGATPRAAQPPQAISPAQAKSLFVLHCAGCHQLDGSGHPNSGVPSMRKMGYFLRSTAGRAFLVQVPGARNATINDAELTALTNWQLQNFSQESLPVDFVPYTTDEVSRWRAHPPLDVMDARTRILQDLQTDGHLPASAMEQLKKGTQ